MKKHYRLSLVDFLVEVITKSKNAKEENHTDPKCTIWILEYIAIKDKDDRNRKIKIILRKMGNGNIHFLSVMEKKRKNPNREDLSSFVVPAC